MLYTISGFVPLKQRKVIIFCPRLFSIHFSTYRKTHTALVNPSSFRIFYHLPSYSLEPKRIEIFKSFIRCSEFLIGFLKCQQCFEYFSIPHVLPHLQNGVRNPEMVYANVKCCETGREKFPPNFQLHSRNFGAIHAFSI